MPKVRKASQRTKRLFHKSKKKLVDPPSYTPPELPEGDTDLVVVEEINLDKAVTKPEKVGSSAEEDIGTDAETNTQSTKALESTSPG